MMSDELFGELGRRKWEVPASRSYAVTRESGTHPLPRLAHTRQPKENCTKKGGAQLSDPAIAGQTAIGCRGNPTNQYPQLRLKPTQARSESFAPP